MSNGREEVQRPTVVRLSNHAAPFDELSVGGLAGRPAGDVVVASILVAPFDKLSARRLAGRRARDVAVAAILVALFSVAGLASAVAQPEDAEARWIAQELQCPVCQGLSVADSPSELATQMRGIIREKLRAGETREEIVRYFVDRYGESILITPPHAGFTAVIWIAPYVALALGIGLLISRLRRSSPSTGAMPEGSDGAADAPADSFYEEVDRTIERLRDRSLR